MQAAQTQALVATVAAAPPPLPVAFVQAQPAVATGVLGAAAIAGGLVLAGPRLVGRDGLAAKASVQLLRGVRWTAAALLGATVAATRVLCGAASGAVQGAARAAVPPPSPAAHRAPAPAPKAPAAVRCASPSAVKPQAEEYDAVAPAELAARLAALEEEEDAAEEAAYLAALAASRSQAPAAKPRKLSEEEVQQRIAVMKGEVSPRAPVPQARNWTGSELDGGGHGCMAVQGAPWEPPGDGQAVASHCPQVCMLHCPPRQARLLPLSGLPALTLSRTSAAPRAAPTAAEQAQARGRPHHRQQVW